MQTNGHLDWLSVTFPAGFNPVMVTPETGDWERVGPGRYGYRSLSVSPNGSQMLSEGTDEQGVHVILPGEALADVRQRGLSERGLIEAVLRYNGKVTRLDLALDVFQSNLSVSDFVEAYESGQITTPAKSATRTQSIGDTGDTFYVGSRSSERMMRIYDKNAQMRIVSVDAWLRLELETKKAVAAAMSLAVADEDDTRTVVNASLRAFCRWDNPAYIAATSGRDVELPELPRKPPAFLSWLQAQVIPAAAKFQQSNQDTDVAAMFDAMLQMEMERRFGVVKRK